MSKRIFTGLQPRRLGKLIAELAGDWTASEESRLRERRGHDRLRAPGAGPDHDLPFTDRVIVTLVYLRHQLPHAALAALCQVDRSTVTRAVHEIRPLLAARGFAVPHRPDPRLRTLAGVFAYVSSCGVELRIDGTEVQVRRPRAGRPGRKVFVSGKKKMNTKKATVVTDGEGRTLWAGAFRPGRMHDQTAVRTEGIADLFTQFPEFRAKVDAGYRGLAKEFPDQVQAPPLKPKKDAPPKRPRPGTKPVTGSHRNGSASSTPTPSTSSGGPSRDTSDAAGTSTKPTWPSPAWSPAAPPSGNHTPASTPGQHARALIAHLVVSRGPAGEIRLVAEGMASWRNKPRPEVSGWRHAASLTAPYRKCTHALTP